LEATRPNMLEVANELRRKHGPAALVERLCKEALHNGGRYIIDSIRTVGEVNALRAAGAVLLSIDASQKVRFRRICSRGSSTDKLSFDQFCADEAKELESADPIQPSLLKVMGMAEHRITNCGDLCELHTQLDAVFGQRKWVCIVGPHGTGKTVLPSKLTKALNENRVVFDACEELARGLIDSMGLTQRDFNEFTERVVDFQRRLLDLYVRRHGDAKGRALLSDRSAIDQLAYLDWHVERGRLQKHVLDEEWERASNLGLQSLYAGTHFVLMSPQAGFCKDDGTRMLSSLQEQWDLHAAFVRVFRRAGLPFRRFAALDDDPLDIVHLFSPQAPMGAAKTTVG